MEVVKRNTGAGSVVVAASSAHNREGPGLSHGHGKRDFFTKTWGEGFVEVRDIPPHVTLPQVTPKHVESYVRRLRRRKRLLSRLASHQAGKAQEEAEECSLEPNPRDFFLCKTRKLAKGKRRSKRKINLECQSQSKSERSDTDKTATLHSTPISVLREELEPRLHVCCSIQ
ncbi:hypothetical protein E2C01_045989 [Portunus trituberculatus]|uniref:Uncharacterized protein n=1 Tax=Portunus trituberculatus TaxID=210409 RepID=A0A5B7G4L1_PORTR|nr:hypothetical protein [Portunus trituberculatus]